MPPIRDANRPVLITGVWLRSQVPASPSDTTELEVLVEIDGRWRLVITELGGGPISHITEPSGIRSAIIDPLTAQSPSLTGHIPPDNEAA